MSLDLLRPNEVKCDCPKLLIVDDSDANIFVLSGFCSIENIKFDVVFFLFINISKGAWWGRSNKTSKI